MNKKSIVIETSILSIIIIAIYAVFLSIIFISSNNLTNKTLYSSINIAENIFDGTQKDDSLKKLKLYYKDSSNDDVRISIIEKKANNEYEIIFDSKNLYDSINSLGNELNNLNNITTRKSYYGYNMIYLAIADNEDSKYVIRSAIKESDSTKISRYSLVIGLPILVIIILLYIIYEIYKYNKTIKPLKNEIEQLSELSDIKNEITLNENDIAIISKSINKIKENLNDKINSLNEEKLKNKFILDSINQGFLVISQDKKIILYNKKMSDIFSYSQEEAIGKDYYILGGNNIFNDAILKSINDEVKIDDFDMLYKNKTYQISITPLKYMINDVERKGSIILLQDVSEIRAVAKIKNDFFSNASHELKSPLTTILGYQELISNHIITKQEDIEEANLITIKEAKKMKEMLNDMLTLNKLENNYHKELVNLNIKDIILTLINDLQDKANLKSIKINLTLKNIFIKADKDDIYKLFYNLIDNAIKYNKESGQIFIIMDDINNEIIIKDTGIGIKKEYLSRIFERYYRVDNSRSEKNIEGNGLGLSIVKHIIDYYKFHIDVESIYTIGTTFKIKLC